uniref:Uncharacterized protein n=1 Tax=Arundo donax TaxID=35708 RepID=A0A0A9G1Z7_ARUDO
MDCLSSAPFGCLTSVSFFPYSSLCSRPTNQLTVDLLFR